LGMFTEMDLFSRGARGPRQEALKIVRGDEILDFSMPADVTGDEGAERNDAEMVGAGKIERSAGQLGSEALSFEGRGHFRVIEDDLGRETAIGDQSQVTIDGGFEAMGFFLVDDGDVVEIWLHEFSSVTDYCDGPVYQGNC
jgi:hypothetical protein